MPYTPSDDDVLGACHHLGHVRSIFQLVDVLARLQQSPQERLHRPRILRGKLLGYTKYLLGMVAPDLLSRDGREADPVGDGAGIPGLADAEAVHLADLHIGDHLWRWNGDQSDISIPV